MAFVLYEKLFIAYARASRAKSNLYLNAERFVCSVSTQRLDPFDLGSLSKATNRVCRGI